MNCCSSRRPVDDTHKVDQPTDPTQRIGFRRTMDSNESKIWGGFFVEYTRRDLGL